MQRHDTTTTATGSKRLVQDGPALSPRYEEESSIPRPRFHTTFEDPVPPTPPTPEDLRSEFPPEAETLPLDSACRGNEDRAEAAEAAALSKRWAKGVKPDEKRRNSSGPRESSRGGV